MPSANHFLEADFWPGAIPESPVMRPTVDFIDTRQQGEVIRSERNELRADLDEYTLVELLYCSMSISREALPCRCLESLS